ncbi:MAG TPA: hypothetical protein VJZ71_02620 [Phycisphaerae bacterium]|nr:hypothetical protein [Phycisphaerae bacterium]
MADRRQDEIELEQLTAYLDGELSEGQRAEVEQLVARDPDAARALDSLRHIARRVKSLPRASAPADFALHVADRLEREALLGVADAGSGPSHRPLRWMRPLSLAAGFVLVVTAGWLLWPQVQPRSATETPVAVRPLPRAVPGDTTMAREEEESSLALKTPIRSFASRKMVRPAEKQESDSAERSDRGNEAPLALAPPSISGAAAKSRTAETDLKAEYGWAGAVLQPTTTSAPTSAPTTTSAPAASQPTTRSIP